MESAASCASPPLFYVMLTAWILHYSHLGSPLPDFKTQISHVPAGWSIGIEMIFYLLFPVIWLRRGSSPAAAIQLVALAGS